MSKDDLDIYLEKMPKPNCGVDLLKALSERETAFRSIHHKTKENVQLFAEEQLIQKEEFCERRCEMPGSPRSTFLMVFSPDGQRAASTHGNHNIYVTDLRSGKNIKTLVGHPRTPWCIAFHPTSDQIVASGCLGGQVRIWDLSGGSEVWTTSTQSVIASIAFHPNDRILVIATYNEVYFWDWSQPEPFVHIATNNPKEKVRYVAFDKLGHKLITGIANSPQTRWERARAPVPVPRQERCASPYRRRITQRLVSSVATGNGSNSQPYNNEPAADRESSGGPERERRIALCYRNLVREYELLVHRYLQLYRPPTMIDRGTDPMEPNHLTSGTQTTENSQNTDPAVPGPSGIGNQTSSNENSASSSQPSTSHSQVLITPRRIFSMGRKPPSSIRGTQTLEAKKHKADEEETSKENEKSSKRKRRDSESEDSNSSCDSSPPNEDGAAEPTTNANTELDDQRVLVVNLERLSPERIPSSCAPTCDNPAPSRYRAPRFKRRLTPGVMDQRREMFQDPQSSEGSSSATSNERNPSGGSTARSTLQSPSNRYSERFNEYIRVTKEKIAEFRRRSQNVQNTEGSSDLASQENTEAEGNRIAASASDQAGQVNNQPPSQGAHSNVEELLSNIRRTAEEEVRNRILPIIRSVPPPDRPELIRLFENSREHVRMRFRQMYPVFLRRHCRRTLRIDSSTDSSSSENEQDHSNTPSGRLSSSSTPRDPELSSLQGSATNAESANASSTGPTERNFNTQLEQLVTSLFTEIDRSENENGDATTQPNASSGSGMTVSPNSSSARTRPSRLNWNSDNNSRPNPPPGESIENMFYEPLVPPFPPQLDPMAMVARGESNYFFNTNTRTTNSTFYMSNSSGSGSRADNGYNPNPGPHHERASMTPQNDLRRNYYLNTDTRTTNSTIYLSNTPSPGQRRRFFSHRVSAFMPTRVNYTRTRSRRNPHYNWAGGRAENTRSNQGIWFTNLPERGNAQEYAPSTPQPSSSESQGTDSGRLGILCYNIVQDLGSSLDDLRHIRASRPGETSDMLSNFSERLENIMTQSHVILNNLRSSIALLSNTAEAARPQENEPVWNFNDSGFYVRDLRNEGAANSESSSFDNDSSLQDLIGSLHAVATDHTYPRNPNNPASSDNTSPLTTSLHITLSHIQRQARLLRRQVESIERIDRAMIEVSQLQLMRQLVIELVRHVRTLSAGDSRTSGVSSVRQMMAGTRISDSSPYESPNEEGSPGTSRQPEPRTPEIQTGINSVTSNTDQPTTSSGNTHQRRSTNRKTYPPSRFVRFARHYHRRPSIAHSLARRYLNRFERGIRQSQQSRTGGVPRQPSAPSNNPGWHPIGYSTIDSSSLSLMTTRLEHLLTEQMRIFSRNQEPPAPSLTSGSVDLGEHILTLRLHGCWLRMNRVLGNGPEYDVLRGMRSNTNSAVSPDGASRYSARHTLCLIVDGMSRHVEELGSSNIPNATRMQINGVLAMALLLTELLLLQVVDSVPAPSGFTMEPERESLTRRIDEICSDILQNRINSGSANLIRSFHVMRVTMRHAHSTLERTYTARRNAMLPSQSTDRRQLLGTINRCLRAINRAQGRSSPNDSRNMDNTRYSTSNNENGSDNSNNDAWYSTINDLITRYSDNRGEESTNQPSTSREHTQNRDNVSSTNDNSDDDPDDGDSEWYYHRGSNSSNASNLYRTNNVNLVQENEPNYPPRLWSVPSVQVNDVPVSESSFFPHRLMTHRQRVSELRSNPRIGMFRPRFLHPLYANVNPFEADLDDAQREQIYDSEMIATVTPNHRIQAWDISNWTVPSISSSIKNIVVNECKIHNDASVDIATDGTILVTLLPSGGYLNVTNRLGVYSLRWETLGQCLYTTSFEQNAVSVSLSPLGRHLLVGFASRRVSIIPSDRWVMARIYKLEQKNVPGDRLPSLRDLEQQRESRINCIRWLPTSGQGLIYATNTGQLVILS